ncbi:hypothetical protein [Pectobacterium parmentieri]|uniref:hypothetical protein n=1 Tax=Pectobacterium parmentieri TaxID=1905730 RepID=UPI000D6213D0|nr:hypothetical protein [Pectobacterium parmentieri]PWD66534.1 hypothetical protein DF211_01920 [Pectobacterium parmentieri]
MEYKYFCYDPDTGFETYKTEDEAKNAATDAIDYYRGDAADGWPDEVSQVCWGEVKQETIQVGLRPKDEEDKSNCDMICDYQLADI